MTTLFDLVDQAELDRLIADGRIGKQVHPKLPLTIYNYTARAQYVNEWTASERVCRGLIVEDGTNKVIARGPEKFFNYGQTGAPEISMDDEVIVTRKEDGSLGIGWRYGGEYGISTRGSFMSDQAVHATAMLDQQLKAEIATYDWRNQTKIFEIVYPENRIVLDYGGRDELIALGNVDNETGVIIERYSPTIVRLRTTLAEALSMQIPSDEEGYVLDVIQGGDTTGHVKLKGEDYKILHGLLTNTSARRIWVQLAARGCHHWIKSDDEWASKLKNDPEDFKRVDVTKDIVDTFLTNVPDEFYDWVTRQIDSINDKVSDLVIQSILLGSQISMTDDKRARYEAVKNHPMCKEILQYVESRDESVLIVKAWALAKPSGSDTPFKSQTEED
jgi:RNA ligase